MVDLNPRKIPAGATDDNTTVEWILMNFAEAYGKSLGALKNHNFLTS